MTIEMDNSDKLKVLLADAKHLRRDVRAARRQRRHLSLRAARRDATRSATASARSRAPGRARSRRSSPRASDGRRRSRSLFDFCARVDRDAHQPARRRGADQGRRVRRICSRARASLLASVGLALRLGRARRPRMPTRAACSTSTAATRMARARRSRRWSPRASLEHQGAAHAREDGARLLSLGPPVRPERGRGAALRQAPHRRPDRHPRAAAAVPASSATCASSTASAAASRIFKLDDMSDVDRGGGQRGAARRQPRRCCKDDELRDRAGPASSPTASRGGVRLQRARSVWDLAAARCRFGKYLRVEVNGSIAAGRRGAARLPVASLADRARRGARKACACACSCTAAGGGRARPRRRGALLPQRRRARALADERRPRADCNRLRVSGMLRVTDATRDAPTVVGRKILPVRPTYDRARRPMADPVRR